MLNTSGRFTWFTEWNMSESFDRKEIPSSLNRASEVFDRSCPIGVTATRGSIVSIPSGRTSEVIAVLAWTLAGIVGMARSPVRGSRSASVRASGSPSRLPAALRFSRWSRSSQRRRSARSGKSRQVPERGGVFAGHAESPGRVRVDATLSNGDWNRPLAPGQADSGKVMGYPPCGSLIQSAREIGAVVDNRRNSLPGHHQSKIHKVGPENVSGSAGGWRGGGGPTPGRQRTQRRRSQSTV